MDTAGSFSNPAKAPYKTRWSNLSNGNRVLQFFRASDGAVLQELDAVGGDVRAPNVGKSIRVRLTIAQINAGATLLPALPGWKYRLISVAAIAYGGAVGATTTVDVLGTLSASSRKLAAFAQANLTQSTYLAPGLTGCTILADGASFTANDVNTAITASKTGASLTVATGVDFIVDYAIER